MKKYCLILLLFFCFVRVVSAQDSIRNAGFESWQIDSLPPEPDQWKSTNPLAYESTGMPNVSKVSDPVSGNFAIKLENLDDGQGGVIFGAALIGGLPDVQNLLFPGGFALAGRPDSIVFYYKCNMVPGDSAMVGVVLKVQGQAIAFNITNVGGVVNTYTRVSKAISYIIPFNPDTAWIGMLSGDVLNNNPQKGSALWIDDIQLIRNSSPLPSNVPNGSFEDWIVHSFDDPDHWGTTNALTGFEGLYSATKSTDMHSGSYSLRIETMTVNDGVDTVGIASSGKIWSNGDLTGGMPYTEHPHFLGFWYKYASPAPSFDSAMAAVYFIQDGLIKDTAMKAFGPSASWEYKEFFLDFDIAFQKPDSLNIVFASSHFFGDRSTVVIGSVLNVDDVKLRMYQATIPEADENIQSFLAYPNPADRQVQFNYHLRESGDISLMTYDITGRQIGEEVNVKSIAGTGNIVLDTEKYSAGIYLYRFVCGGQIISGKFTVER